MKKGDQIYFLSDYVLERGIIISVGPKAIKIDQKIFDGNLREYRSYLVRVPKEKCASPEEKIRVIWETWKGRNGRGGYRLERELYPEKRVPAKEHPSRGYIEEKEYGTLK